jgi:hypothetical protein
MVVVVIVLVLVMLVVGVVYVLWLCLLCVVLDPPKLRSHFFSTLCVRLAKSVSLCGYRKPWLSTVYNLLVKYGYLFLVFFSGTYSTPNVRWTVWKQRSYCNFRRLYLGAVLLP